MIIILDDLFDDEGEKDQISEDKIPEGLVKPVNSIEPEEHQNKIYINEDWKINEATKLNSINQMDESSDLEDIVTNYPCFALMYKFKDDYINQDIDPVVIDHDNYSNSFKRLVNSEVLQMGNDKGAVMLWTGISDDDTGKMIKDEIMTYVQEDPLFLKDIVEKWEIIELSE